MIMKFILHYKLLIQLIILQMLWRKLIYGTNTIIVYVNLNANLNPLLIWMISINIVQQFCEVIYSWGYVNLVYHPIKCRK